MRSTKADALLEALPYFQQFRGRTVVVKYGGAAMEKSRARRERPARHRLSRGGRHQPRRGPRRRQGDHRRHAPGESLAAKFVDGFPRTRTRPPSGSSTASSNEVISPSLAKKIGELGGKAQVLSGQGRARGGESPAAWVDATGAKIDLGFVGDIQGDQYREGAEAGRLPRSCRSSHRVGKRQGRPDL